MFIRGLEFVDKLRCQIDGPGPSDGGGASSGGGTDGGNGSSLTSTSPSSSTPSSDPGSSSSSPTPSGTVASPGADHAGSQTAAPTGVGDTGFDFLSLFDDSPTQPAATPPTAPTQPAATPPASPQQAAAPEAAVQPPAATGQTQPAPAPATSQTSFDASDPMSAATALRQMQEPAIQHIAQTMFALSPQDIEGLETDAAGTIPRLLAKVFVVAQEQYLQQMARMVPRMMERHTELTTQRAQAETNFFKAFPSLNAQTHGDLIKRVATAYRSANPQAPLDQVISEVGAMVMHMAKVAPAAPAAQPKTNGAARPTPAFVPAASGTASIQSQPAGGDFDFLGATS